MKVAGNRGFTLVELLLVVSIVAVLTSLVVPSVQAAALASRRAKVEHDLRTIQDGLERHYADKGYYPVKLKDLVSSGYLKPGFSFLSPTAGHWYFYAVDNNHPKRARAYVLGNPDPASPKPCKTCHNDLHRTGPLPQGWDPGVYAWGWLACTDHCLTLYQEDDHTEMPLPQVPHNLHAYRADCHAGSTEPCDLIAN